MKNTKTNTQHQKLKSICIRVTNDEFMKLEQLAKQNHQNKSTYILNQALNPYISNIYNQTFMQSIFKISSFVDNFSTNNPDIQKSLNLLREEVHQLWLHLQ